MTWQPKSSLTVGTSHWTSRNMDSVPLHSSSRLWDLDFQMKCTIYFNLKRGLWTLSNSPVLFLLSPGKMLLTMFRFLEQPPLSVMTLCDLPSLWRVSMIVFWIKSAVLSIIVVSKNEMPTIYTVWVVVIYWNSNVNILIFWDTYFWLSWAVSS